MSSAKMRQNNNAGPRVPVLVPVLAAVCAMVPESAHPSCIKSLSTTLYDDDSVQVRARLSVSILGLAVETDVCQIRVGIEGQTTTTADQQIALLLKD